MREWVLFLHSQSPISAQNVGFCGPLQMNRTQKKEIAKNSEVHGVHVWHNTKHVYILIYKKDTGFKLGNGLGEWVTDGTWTRQVVSIAMNQCGTRDEKPRKLTATILC